MNKYNLQYNFLSSAWSIIYLLLLLLQYWRTSTSTIVVQREMVKNFLLVDHHEKLWENVSKSTSQYVLEIGYFCTVDGWNPIKLPIIFYWDEIEESKNWLCNDSIIAVFPLKQIQ